MRKMLRLLSSLGLSTAIVIGYGGRLLNAQNDPNAAPNPYRMEEFRVQLPDDRKLGAPLGQKIEAVGNRSIRRSVIGRRAVVGNMQQRIADLAIFVLGCCELHSQNQAQL